MGGGFFENFLFKNKKKKKTPKGVNIIGAEKIVRPDTLIEVKQMTGDNLPF